MASASWRSKETNSWFSYPRPHASAFAYYFMSWIPLHHTSCGEPSHPSIILVLRGQCTTVRIHFRESADPRISFQVVHHVVSSRTRFVHLDGASHIMKRTTWHSRRSCCFDFVENKRHENGTRDNFNQRDVNVGYWPGFFFSFSWLAVPCRRLLFSPSAAASFQFVKRFLCTGYGYFVWIANQKPHVFIPALCDLY